MSKLWMVVGIVMLAGAAEARVRVVRTPALTRPAGGWMNCYVSVEASKRPELTARMLQGRADVGDFVVANTLEVGGVWYGEVRTGTVAEGASTCEVRSNVRGVRVELVAFDTDGLVVGQVFGK